MDDPPGSVFAYGTLMRGERLHAHMLYLPPVCILPGRIRGQLIHLRGYPGLVPGPGEVEGEYFEYPAGIGSLLKRLDRLEGPSYRRVRAEVRLEDGSSREAWVYEWAGEPGAGPLIPSGSWRAR